MFSILLSKLSKNTYPATGGETKTSIHKGETLKDKYILCVPIESSCIGGLFYRQKVACII
jgi:hypothetical protein